MPFWEQMLNNISGGILGIGIGAINDKRQVNQQERLQNLQIKGSKELTDYQMMKQLEMWKATNYEAQMEELRKAGLNPGLIYGMGGAGGATTGSASGSVAGGQAPSGGQEIMGGIGMAMQIQMNKAQLELIAAQTEKTKAEAAKTAGVDTELGMAQVLLTGQEFRNKIGQEAGIKLDNRLKEIQTAFQERTLEDSIDTIRYNTIRALNEADIAGNNAQIGDATIQAEITRIKAEAIEAGLRNILLQEQQGLPTAQKAEAYSRIQLNKETVINWVRENQLKWAQYDQEQQKVAIMKLMADFQQNEKPWNDAAINLFGNLINGVILKQVLTPGQRTEIKGFGGGKK